MGRHSQIDAAPLPAVQGPLRKRFLLFQQGSLSAILLPPSRFRDVEATIGLHRAAAFRQVSPFAPADQDLDGRDPHYWHLLICEQVSGQLLGAQRLAFSLWQSADWGAANSYLEHSYPGLAQGFAAAGLSYLEVGRVFVVPQARQDLRVLPSLIRASGLLAKATGHRYILGLMSYRWISQNSWGDWLFLDRIQRPPYHLNLPLPLPRHPLHFPLQLSNLSPLREHLQHLEAASSGQPDLEILARQIRCLPSDKLFAEASSFRLPGLIRIYNRFVGARVAGLSLARDFNQIVEVLMGTDLQWASQGALHPGLDIPCRTPWLLE